MTPSLVRRPGSVAEDPPNPHGTPTTHDGPRTTNTTMFNLDKAIAAWRQSLRYNRAFTADDLDELAQHVRDQVAALVAEGSAVEAAFRRTMREMGDYTTAEAEYRKVYWGKRRRRHELRDELTWRRSMFTNYLTVAFRAMRRRWGYSLLNITGLALGLICCLIIFQYVAYEYSFDDFNENAATLYRVTETSVRNSEEPRTIAMSPYAMGPALTQAVPEVARFARIHMDYAAPVILNTKQPDKAFVEPETFYADPAFLQMFSYPLASGENRLDETGTMLLSASAAQRYFGDADPIGKVLRVNGWTSGDFRVTGVLEDVPTNSHLQFDVILPMEDLLRQAYSDNPNLAWGMRNFNTYVQLRPDANRAEVERKFTDVLMANRKEEYRQANITAHLNVQPLHDVHLNEAVGVGGLTTGSYRTVYFFTLIGLVLFLIALINYVNLSTARALDRAREVGVRKSVGAQRRQLVIQFLFESALTNGIALILAVAGAVLLLPLVNRMADTRLTMALWASPSFATAFAATFCAGTLLAGIYPAFVLSSFRPVAALKGKAGAFASHLWLRKGLVVLQFTASTVLVASTFIVYDQLTYMRHLDLGIDLEHVVTVSGPRVLGEGINRDQAIGTFTQELRKLPGIRQIATSSKLPGRGFNWYTSARQATADPASIVPVVLTRIDTSFADFFGLTLVAGENFRNRAGPTPENEPYDVIANESAVHAIGFDTPDDAVDQIITLGGDPVRIVGVFKDFTWSSAHKARENIFFERIAGGLQVSLKVNTENLPETLAAVEKTYATLFPGNPFQYTFADEQFDQQYRNDQGFASLFSLFAGLAIVIACLGLFGLAAFTATQRTKEIGVRKTLGASVGGLVALLSKDFLVMVGLSFVIAAPVAYVLMSRWLGDFAYRIALGPGVFLLAGGLMLLIAVLTVSYQAIKASLADPVKSLRYE